MPRGRKPKPLTVGTKCRHFNKGADGFCVHYTGSKRMKSSCFDKCNLDERHKSRRFN